MGVQDPHVMQSPKQVRTFFSDLFELKDAVAILGKKDFSKIKGPNIITKMDPKQ